MIFHFQWNSTDLCTVYTYLCTLPLYVTWPQKLPCWEFELAHPLLHITEWSLTNLCAIFIYLCGNRTAPIHLHEYPSLHSKELSPCNKNLSLWDKYWSLTKAKSLRNDQNLYTHLLSIISVQNTDALIVTFSATLLTGLWVIPAQNDVLQYIPKDLSISAVQISIPEAYRPISTQFPVTLPISEENITFTLTMSRWQASSPVCGLSWQHHFGILLNCLSWCTDWLLIQNEIDKSGFIYLLAVSTKPLNFHWRVPVKEANIAMLS